MHILLEGRGLFFSSGKRRGGVAILTRCMMSSTHHLLSRLDFTASFTATFHKMWTTTTSPYCLFVRYRIAKKVRWWKYQSPIIFKCHIFHLNEFYLTAKEVFFVGLSQTAAKRPAIANVWSPHWSILAEFTKLKGRSWNPESPLNLHFVYNLLSTGQILNFDDMPRNTRHPPAYICYDSATSTHHIAVLQALLSTNNNTSKTGVAPWCYKWIGYGWISGYGEV